MTFSSAGMTRPVSPLVSTVGDTLVRTANERPDSLAIVDGGRSLTYEKLLAGAEVVAARLQEHGVTKGSRVGVLMPNSAEAVEAVFATAFLGAVCVLMNSRFATRELRHVLEDSRVDAVVVSGMRNDRVDFERQLRESLPENSKLPVFVLGRSSDFGFLELSDDRAAHSDALRDRMSTSRSGVPLRSPAIMIYTSGTTSLPKGCVISHEALVRLGTEIGRNRLGLCATDRVWAPLPVFHIGFFIPMIASLDAGAAVITNARFDADEALAAIVEHRVTVAWSAFPALNDAVVSSAAGNPGLLGSIRTILSVAPPETMRKLQDRLPHATVIGCYGSTEVGGVCVVAEPSDTLDQRTRTQGRPLPGVEVVTVEPSSGALLGPGERGELAVRGWSVFDGYWRDADQTARVTTAEGYVRTGDLGFIDEGGRVTFTGRVKDMIKVGGENVAALEVESVLVSHPLVAVAAVVGIADSRLGEVPAAFVELVPGATLHEAELVEFCRSQLARYKVPKVVRFRTAWPMSATKIRKSDLVAELQAELASATS
jgi:acyl-CoA synthetase (AMP-forming)/AMP-acid ligase II